MTQLTIDDQPGLFPDEIETFIEVRARTADPSTSKAAAAALENNQQHVQQSVERAVEIIRESGQLADFELRILYIEAWGGSDSLPTKARHWAREQGLVRDSGQKIVNPISGRRCIVWGLGKDDDFLNYHLVRCGECGHVSRELKDSSLID